MALADLAAVFNQRAWQHRPSNPTHVNGWKFRRPCAKSHTLKYIPSYFCFRIKMLSHSTEEGRSCQFDKFGASSAAPTDQKRNILGLMSKVGRVTLLFYSALTHTVSR